MIACAVSMKPNTMEREKDGIHVEEEEIPESAANGEDYHFAFVIDRSSSMAESFKMD